MGCKVKSVAMAAAASNAMLWWLTITLEADRGNIMLVLSTQNLESSRSVCFLETVSSRDFIGVMTLGLQEIRSIKVGHERQ